MSSPKPTLDDLRIEHRDKAEAKSKTRPRWIIALVLLLSVASIWWLRRPTAVAVRTAVAREAGAGAGNDRTVLNASGYVTARREATVSSKITGKVTELLLEEGMRVK